MGSGRPDEHREFDETMEPTDSTAAWERFAPARDDLGPELEPDWRERLDRGREWFDGGPAPVDRPHPVGRGSDSLDDKNWFGVRRRRIPRSKYVVSAILIGLLSISGWLTIADIVRTRSQGTQGTFELEDCRYKRSRTEQGVHHCVASFTDDAGEVHAPVKVIVDKSPEEGGTTRTGWLLGRKGWGDDVGIRSRMVFQLFSLVLILILIVVVGAVRAERDDGKPGAPGDDPFA